MLGVLAVVKILAVAMTMLSPSIIKEVSEAVGASVALTEAMLNHESGEVKKEKATNLVNESLDVIFIKFPVNDEQKDFIEEKLVPNLIVFIVWVFNKLGIFGKKQNQDIPPKEGDPNFMSPIPN